MKIDAISNSLHAFKGQPLTSDENKKKDVNCDYAFLYEKHKTTINLFSWHKKEFIAGFFALAAAIYSLTRFAGRNTTPKNAVELFGSGVGLNIFPKNDTIVRLLKEKILYPAISINKGYAPLLKRKDLKTGLIIGGEGAEAYTKALFEHAKALGIECIDLRTQGGNRLKEVNKAISAALERHAEDKNKCVMVEIGDIGAFSKLISSKTSPESNIEKRLQNIPKGVIWVGWTEKSKSLPYFYNNTPTLYAIIKK